MYLDDIIVFSTTFQEHLTQLSEVLNWLRSVSIYIKLLKCTFCANTVHYLGHVVSSEGVAPDLA